MVGAVYISALAVSVENYRTFYCQIMVFPPEGRGAPYAVIDHICVTYHEIAMYSRS